MAREADIRLRKKHTSGSPSAGDLNIGEVVQNTAEKRLYGKDNSSAIFEFGTNPSSITTTDITASGTVTASTAFSGNLTGNVTGNVTGDLTGDVTGNVTAASGTTTLNNLSVGGSVTGTLNTADLAVTGNITVSGTVDGRDVATDGTKLDTIETNADVTDSTNVDAAGAVMNTDTTTASMSFVIDEDNMVSDLDTKVPTQQSVKKYVDDTVIAIGGVTVSPTPTAGQYARWTSGSELEGVDLSFDPTIGTLTKTFLTSETALITLSSVPSGQPVVSVTKEVSQTGVSNNSWDVNSTGENYVLHNSAPATTLDFNLIPLSASYNSNSFSVASQTTLPNSFRFNTTGTKMFVVGGNNDTVFEYDLSTAFDVSTAAYNSVSFSVSLQESNPNGIAFNNDGTKMYIVGQTGDDVNEYTLTTGFDLSTASYSQNFSVATQLTSPQGIAFNNDGTSMFVVGWGNDAVFQYDLTTAFDVSTASYASKTLSVAAQDGNPSDIAFNYNGTRMYIIGWSNDDVFEYILTTAFDLSTASYNRVFHEGVEETAPEGLTFNADYTKMYIAGGGSDTVFEYDVTKEIQSVSLGTGSFASTDVGKNIKANSGEMILTSAAGSVYVTTIPTSYNQVASGSWEMYGIVYNTADDDLELIRTLENTFDLSEAVYSSRSFSVASEEATPYAITFNNDGTKMFILGATGDDVNEYTLTTPFSVITASYSQNFSVATEDTTPIGIEFNTDGTKMFILGNAGDDVNEYNLTTGFDVSTATYSQNFSVTTEDTNPRGIAFSTDGTKMFIVGATGIDINEYTLSVAFDISTASFVDSFVVSGQDVAPQDVHFSTDGTRMFVLGQSNDTVFQYALSTGFDVSTASYSKSFSITSEEAGPFGIAFNAEGNRMYLIGNSQDTVFEYEVGSEYKPSGYNAVHTKVSTDSTYWTDINSMTVDETPSTGNIYYAVSTDDRTTWSVVDNTNGVRDIVRNNLGTWEYNSNTTYGSETWTAGATNTELATLEEAAGVLEGYTLTDASYASKSFDVGSQESAPTGVAFNTDGTKMFIIGSSGDDVNEYTLAVAFDVTTAVIRTAFSVATQTTVPQDLAFNNDGTKMFVLSSSGDNVNEYDLTTGFDVSTASFSQLFSVSGQETTPNGIAFNNDGTKMFIVGNVGDDVNEYALTTGFDISTASFTQSFSVATEEINPQAIAFNSDGTKMFICGVGGDDVNEYNLSTGFDVSTASYSQNFSVSSEDTAPLGLTFNSDGTKMFIVGNTTDTVYQYNVGLLPNQMDKTQLEAVTDANHFTLGNDLDLAIIFNQTTSGAAPSSDGVSINYDANTLNEGAVLGTDYDFDYPASNKVRITSLGNYNLKVRVV